MKSDYADKSEYDRSSKTQSFYMVVVIVLMIVGSSDIIEQILG